MSLHVPYACLKTRGYNIYSSMYCKSHGNSTEQPERFIKRAVIESYFILRLKALKEKDIQITGYLNTLVGTSEYSVWQTGLCQNTCPDLAYNAQLRNSWEQQHWFSFKPKNSNKKQTLEWQPARFLCRVNSKVNSNCIDVISKTKVRKRLMWDRYMEEEMEERVKKKKKSKKKNNLH